jgi:hypothetical protein
MNSANTTPEKYDDEIEQSEKLTQEEILMSENDILQGLLDSGKEKDNTDSYRKIQIKRNGRLYFEFRVRPMSEDESNICRRQATPKVKDKGVKPETNWVKFRSLLIYSATVNEDRAKTWDNQQAQKAFSIFEGWEMIDKVILAGEKDAILDIIDEISGSGAEVAQDAKN